MKNISMAIVGLGLLAAGSAHADGNLGNFGPYVGVNSNEVGSHGVQVEVPAEGRLNAYAPSTEVIVIEGDHVQIAVSSEGRLNAYGS
ncbi:MAG: hypothetical protein JKY90_07300 [Gammaproteobacteria bacterium]|nr:hypothetical protein [Gammaproteobacteria bacterium]